MNPNQSETKLSIRINPNEFEVRLVLIHSDCCLGLNRFGWIDFLPFFMKRETKRFSVWFGIIRIGSDTEIEMNRNSSDWLGMHSYPILISYIYIYIYYIYIYTHIRYSKRTFLEPSIGTFREHLYRTFVELFVGTFREHSQRMFWNIPREHFLRMFLELFSTAFRKISL